MQFSMEFNEIWANVIGYEGSYKVSNKGVVKSLGRVVLDKNGKSKNIKEKLLGQSKSIRGYYSVNLTIKGERRAYTVHRLMAKAFIPNPENKPQVNHKDGNKFNNNIQNLEWVTGRENIEHYYKTAKKTSRFLGVTYMKNSNNWMAKIQHNKKKIYLGCYKIEYEAHIAYQKALSNFKRQV